MEIFEADIANMMQKKLRTLPKDMKTIRLLPLSK